MDVLNNAAGARSSHAAQVLRRLDELGAVRLDVLVSKAAEIQGIAGLELDDGDICYPFYIRIGPRADFDLVTVANQVRDLGFELRRIGPQTKG
jgi:hypothetical protein